MSDSTRYIPAVLLALISVAIPLWAQSPTKITKLGPRSAVSGRITIKGKGAAGVAVGLRKSDPGNPFDAVLKGITDQDGVYHITNVPAGNYEVTPTAPAFVAADNVRSKNVVLGEDESVDDINFALVRGGVITGKVTDADGRGVIQQQVTLYFADAVDQPAPPQSQQRQLVPAASAQTDDRGVYRMFGVAAGRYRVASGRGEDTFSGSFSTTRTPYKQVFHPDVTDQAKATIIEVSEGSEAANVDITLGRPVQSFSASGRVIDGEKGMPVPNVRFAYQRIAGQRFEFVNSLVTSNAQGDFVAEGLIPGKYGVFLLPDPNNELRADALNFDVIDQDVSGLTVKLIKGASVSGVIVLESDDKTAFAKLVQMGLQTFVMNPSGGGGIGQSARSSISADGSFRLAGLPNGTAMISLGGMMGPDSAKGFMVSRVERDGIVQLRGVEIKEGEQVTGVRVVVSYGNATLRGVVNLENGSLPEGSRIFVRLAKAGDPTFNLRPPRVDERGHFLIEGIPGGVYEVWVSIVGKTRPIHPPVKRDVSVQDGVVTDVTVTIDMSTTPKP